MENLFSINIDYHHSPLGLNDQEISLVHALGFSLPEVFRYFYNLYNRNLLKPYGSRQDVLDELFIYTPMFGLTENEYELDMLRQFLYTGELANLELGLRSCSDLTEYARIQHDITFITNLLQTKGKLIDILCKVFVSINEYLLNNSQYYLKPIMDFSAKTGLPIQHIKPGPINICGGWIVVDFIRE